MSQTNSSSKKDLMINNFIGGLFWGIGSALGATLLVFILGIILTKINVVPLVGTFVSQVNKFVDSQKYR